MTIATTSRTFVAMDASKPFSLNQFTIPLKSIFMPASLCLLSERCLSPVACAVLRRACQRHYASDRARSISAMA
jgi:hypothetical protein